jgi:hypothetical protein
MLEALEDRLAPAMVLWTGGSADWSVAADWTDQGDSSHHVPGATDDAVINTAVSVTHMSTGTDTIKSLTLGAADIASNFSLSAGTLDLSGGTVQNLGNGTFTLSGGTLANAKVSAATTITGTSLGGIFSAVTLAGILDLRSMGGSVGVQNGLTLAGGTVQLGNAAGTTTGGLSFVGGVDQTVDGASAASPGTILFGFNRNNNLFNDQFGTVTFGKNLTIEGTAGYIGFTDNGGGSPFDIQGTLLADPMILNTKAGNIILDGVNWTNHGTIEAQNGDRLVLEGSATGTGPAWTNTAGKTISISGGGSLTLLGSGTPFNGLTWQNQGNITETGSTVDLGGAFSMASLGSFSRLAGPNDGTVNLFGTLNNSGQTLRFGGSIGSWNFSGGTINGGTLSAAPGFALIQNGQPGTLIGVTLDGTGSNAPSPLDLVSLGGSMAIQGGLTLDGSTVQLGNAAGTTGGGLMFLGGVDQTVDGASAANPGTILFGFNRNNNLITAQGGTVTFGKNLTIEGTAGYIGFTGNGGSPFDIQGTFLADPTILNTTAGTFSLDGTNWTNHGTFEAQNGSTIKLGLGLANLAGGTLTSGTWQAGNGGSILFLTGGITTNAATIVLDGTSSRLTTNDSMGMTIDALTSLAANTAAGSLTIQNGSTITAAGNFSNAGAVIIGRFSTLTVSGNFSQASTASLETDLGGSPISGQFGQLVATGTAALDGTLRARFVTGTPPGPGRGDVFTVLTFLTLVSGDFASFDLQPHAGLTLDHGLSETSVLLFVGPPLAPAIIVTPTSGLITTQSGGTATFHVSLATNPQSDVTIPLQSDNTSAGTVPDSVTLTPADARAGVDVIVTGVDDNMLDGDVAYRIIVGPAQSGDANYDALAGDDVMVTNHQTDVAAIIVKPTSGLTTTKSGGQAQFTVVLSTIPSDNVRINLTSSSTAQGTPLPAFLVFNSFNALTPATVTVTGHNDRQMDGDQNYMVITSAAITNDTNYRGLNPANVSLTNVGNEVSIDVSPVSGLVTTQNGGTARFTVTLSSRPTANVVIALQSSNSAEGIPSVSSLTFTPGGRLSQTVMVQGQNDHLMGGPRPYMIVFQPASSGDTRYNGLVAADVSLTNMDTVSGLVITPLTNYDRANALYQTSEAGASASFMVTLSTRPTQAVTVNLTLPSPGTDEAALSATQLTFTSANYQMPQTVTLTGNDDGIADAKAPYSVHFSLSSPDSRYNGINVPDVQAVNLEDGQDAGILLTPLTGFVNGQFVVDEVGDTATFSLALATIPSGVVTVTLTKDGVAGQDANVSPAALTFQPDATALNPQTVTITGLPTGGTNKATLTIDALSSDANYVTSSSHPNLILLNAGAPTQRFALPMRAVMIANQRLDLDVKVDAPFTAHTPSGPMQVMVTVKNVNSFAIPELHVTPNCTVVPNDVIVTAKSASTSATTTTGPTGPVVTIRNLPAQGTVKLSYSIYVTNRIGAQTHEFTVATFGLDGNPVRAFSGSASTSVTQQQVSAVDWPLLAGLGLLAGGRALERYLRRRRKRQEEAADAPHSQSS